MRTQVEVLAERDALLAHDRRLVALGGGRWSVTHSMRLWLDGAKHALEWTAEDAQRNRPTTALEHLELALRPRKARSTS
jgi:hypothetical protein